MAAPKPIDPAINGWNGAYLDEQYDRWKADPGSVSADLGSFFAGFDRGVRLGKSATVPLSTTPPPPGPTLNPLVRGGPDRLQAGVEALVRAYREFGHIAAQIDPFFRERPCPEELNPAFHGLTAADLDAQVEAPPLAPPGQAMPLSELIEALDETYCGTIGVETGHVTSRAERAWFFNRMEPMRNKPALTNPERAHLLYQLYRAETFEKFCGKRYPGVKRFSLEGCDSLIPLLDRMVERAGDAYDVQEIVFGMSHRGRINVLINVLGKMYEQVFTEFEDAWEEDAEAGGGDVKYHRGFSSNRILPSGKHVWLAMASNPSHLEAVGAVAMGRCRAKQRLKGDKERVQIFPIVMHGDGAAIGQGIVAETFNMSQLPGYTVGGTVHIVVNNLIGFTTGEADARSSRYCTDMAKMVEAPVLHVNAEDPEAVLWCADVALDYRMTFKKDIVIDLVGYRRHGHNETDEAMFTQPLLYAQIKNKPSLLKEYAERLHDEGILSDHDHEKIAAIDKALDRAYANVRATPVDPTPDPGHRQWQGMSNAWTWEPGETAAPRELLHEVAHAISTWPETFTPHPKLARVLQDRTTSVLEGEAIDWATAEALAFGSLVCEGNIVRFSGQDCGRGTFSQRHAVLRDVETAEIYVPLNHIHELGLPNTEQDVGTLDATGVPRQAKFCVYDSPLSEYSVLGFEYGFSLASPKILAVWEAQFGDFCNTAQVVIDQFISSAELKWARWSGLTLLLPHGYEGQGPEHSSARLERFLQLSAQQNMQVVYPSTPAQYFHVLRRQSRRSTRKPLIVMTPKSLLRLPACRSAIAELEQGQFHEVLDDPMFAQKAADKKRVVRLILCSGKVYYDLVQRREETGRNDIAIVRVEQLYPLHNDLLADVRATYPAKAELVWVQEEPRNMGAYQHMVITCGEELGWQFGYAGRPYSATPATGSPQKHQEQLEEFLTAAIGPKSTGAPKKGAGAKGTSKTGSKSGASRKKQGSKRKTAAA
ncbi:MAG: 2-oxoglutarate dehydrogenase E1 component [Phycisphaerales bacterium]|nr:2-oxoglutarate dehydrogenase E1 component [Phycisphaerales bacterium]